MPWLLLSPQRLLPLRGPQQISWDNATLGVRTKIPSPQGSSSIRRHRRPPQKPTRLYFHMQKSTMIANYDVKMGTFISRGMLCNKSNDPTLVLTSTGGIILYLKIIGFPEILNCFFAAFPVYAVAHSMVCAVSKRHRLFHCFIIYQEILKAVSEKLTAFKG